VKVYKCTVMIVLESSSRASQRQVVPVKIQRNLIVDGLLFD
jgi:hypothetical protein